MPSANITNRVEDTLDLEQLDDDLFRGDSPNKEWARIYGGQVIGQALTAACRTVPDRAPHSLHAYFILPGDPRVPIIFRVERLRDGGSFSTRRVTATQHGKAIYSMIASFHAEETGFEYQVAMPSVPPPEDLVAGDRMIGPDMINGAPSIVQQFFAREPALEYRPVEPERFFGERLMDGRSHFWMRIRHPLPDDPDIHRACLAYASDFTTVIAILAPHNRAPFMDDMMCASIDHAMWFYRPFRADGWMLYAHDTPISFGGRGLSRGNIFTRDGTLIASMTQEGLIRTRRATP